ncbi:MAG: SDR family oxidoreductase [Candidatus Obscuribacterales bacterium]|nr:SDR family oxidoreductase [Candidatus Obscuribacterales bacterium]
MEAEERSSEDDNTPVYLVLGAAGGVGSELVKRLRLRGARVIRAVRNIEPAALEPSSDSSPLIEFDACDMKQMQDCFDTARNFYGRLDGVACCVGSILLKPAHLTSDQDWQSIISVNLSSAFAAVKFASKIMMGRGGSIVLVSSCAARFGLPNHEAIAAAKAGVEGLVRSAAATYSRHQIRVNCVSPGMLKTKLTQSIRSNEMQLQASTEMHPLGRIGEAADVAALMDWLLGDESGWVTGQCIAVDGGLSSMRSSRTQRTSSNAVPASG